MALYEKISAQIYSIILRYAAPCDVHVYSIDESFIDATPYLSRYAAEAEATGKHPAHVMAMTIIKDVLKETGITATVGIGTNLYLAKVCMDTIAKKAKPDADGVRIAELNEDSYKFLLWDHRPLTDFWMLGPGKAARLEKAYLFTMGRAMRYAAPLAPASPSSPAPCSPASRRLLLNCRNVVVMNTAEPRTNSSTSSTARPVVRGMRNTQSMNG